MKEMDFARKQVVLQIALGELKPKLRELIILKDILQLSHRQIADIRHCSPVRISCLLNKGRKQFHSLFAKIDLEKCTLKWINDDTYFN